MSGREEVGTEERPGDVSFGGVLLDEGVVLAVLGVKGYAVGLNC
jgi:hypothetical protein